MFQAEWHCYRSKVIWLDQKWATKSLTCWSEGLKTENSPVRSMSTGCMSSLSILVKSKQCSYWGKALISRRNLTLFSLKWASTLQKDLPVKLSRDMWSLFIGSRCEPAHIIILWDQLQRKVLLQNLGPFLNGQLANDSARTDEEQAKEEL